MLNSARIKNFRCFRDLKIESLKRVNLIIGQNDTGKTGVLEALALLLWEPSPAQCVNLPNLFRSAGGDPVENFWKWLFYNKSLKQNVEIDASFDNQKDFGVVLQPDQNIPINLPSQQLRPAGIMGAARCFTTGGSNVANAGFKPAIFSTRPSDPTQDAIKFNRVILKRRKKQVEKMLREIEPRLETSAELFRNQP